VREGEGGISEESQQYRPLRVRVKRYPMKLIVKPHRVKTTNIVIDASPRVVVFQLRGLETIMVIETE